MPFRIHQKSKILKHPEQRVMEFDAQLGFDYYRSWCSFRSVSNEVEEIAGTVSSILHRNLRSNEEWTLLDIGAADGMSAINCLKHAIDSGIVPPRQVVLSEPHDFDFSCATKLFRQHWAEPVDLQIHRCDAHQLRIDHLRNYRNVISLFIHSAYYIAEEDIGHILNFDESRGAVFVVDALESVFGRVWSIFNPEMYARLQNIHNYLARYFGHKSRVLGKMKIMTRSRGIDENVASFLLMKNFGDLTRAQRNSLIDVINQHMVSSASESYVEIVMDAIWIE